MSEFMDDREGIEPAAKGILFPSPPNGPPPMAPVMSSKLFMLVKGRGSCEVGGELIGFCANEALIMFMSSVPSLETPIPPPGANIGGARLPPRGRTAFGTRETRLAGEYGSKLPSTSPTRVAGKPVPLVLGS